MKECDILKGRFKTYSDPSYIFSGGQNLPTSRIYAPWWATRTVEINRGEDSMWAVIYEDCRRRVTCTHVLEFCLLGHDNLSRVEQQTLSGGHCLLGADQM